VAEAKALLYAVEALEQKGIPEGVETVVLHGDSRLVVDFANRRAKPGKAELFLTMRRVASVKKRMRGVRWAIWYVKREHNILADWLCNVARTLRQSWAPITYDALPLHLGDQPPWEATCAVEHVELP